MKPFVVFLLSFLLFGNLLASSTVIQGSIKGYDGEQIRLAYYEDYISNKKVRLGEALIEGEQFRVDFDLDKTRQIVIMIQDKQTSLFAENGQVYNIYLSYSAESNSSRAFEKYLDLKFSFPKAEELNQQIKKFNTDYQNFFSKNYRKIVVREASEEIENFISEQEAIESYKDPEYLKLYVDYTLANLKDISQKDKTKLYQEYLEGRAVKTDHKEYINFFTHFYNEDFEQLLITKEGSEIMKSIMFDHDLEKSLRLIKGSKKFKSQELTELYTIHGLFEVFYKKTIEQKSNLEMLDQLSEKASTEDLKTLARNVRSKLIVGSEDSKAPAFALENSKGETVSLENLKGKVIYMGFWANWSTTSLRELKLMQKLNEEYGDKIHFISINIDEDKEIFRSVKEQSGYSWSFLYAGDQYQFREEYEIKTAPIYYLIDENGKILQRYAAGPQNIERQLKRIAEKGS